MFEIPEPIERLEEMLAHPSDTTFNALHDKELATKKRLANERREFETLFEKLSKQPDETAEQEMRALKQRIVQSHDELMEILKSEEKISREIQKNRFL